MDKHRLALLVFVVIISRFFTISAQDLRLFPDSVHAPFIYGVASGDPTANSVIIWTAIGDGVGNQSFVLSWEVAVDSSFVNPVAFGAIQTDSSTDFTAQTEVTGLLPDHGYFFRFFRNNQFSAIGTTYTAPSGIVDSLSLAVISCSSVFSGFFNAYRNMANRPELRGIIHLGDYIYDFVDEDEQVRVPPGLLPSLHPDSLSHWRGQHRLYLLDPDLREARRKLPFILIWDNHDVVASNPGRSARAFWEYNPIRQPDNSDPLRIWRKLEYGSLLDVFMIDMLTQAGSELFPSGNEAIMSFAQFDWLKSGLKQSTAVWRIMGSQKFFSPWELGSIAGLLPGSGLSKTWNGFPESRDSLLSWVHRQSIDNFVVLSGDLHMSIWSDLALSPFDSLAYDGSTGTGGLGVEVMGTSVSRGNLDESGVSTSLAEPLYQSSFIFNPQQQYLNLYDHGYTTLTFSADSLIVRAWLNPILSVSSEELLDKTGFVMAGDNHWKRLEVMPSVSQIGKPGIQFTIAPNPASDQITIFSSASEGSPITFTIIDFQGKRLQSVVATQPVFSLSVDPISSGKYFLVGVSKRGRLVRQFQVP